MASLDEMKEMIMNYAIRITPDGHGGFRCRVCRASPQLASAARLEAEARHGGRPEGGRVAAVGRRRPLAPNAAEAGEHSKPVLALWPPAAVWYAWRVRYFKSELASGGIKCTKNEVRCILDPDHKDPARPPELWRLEPWARAWWSISPWRRDVTRRGGCSWRHPAVRAE